MPSRASMIHRADIERNVALGTDAYGHLNPGQWSLGETNVPCRLYSKARRFFQDGDKEALSDDIRAIFSLLTNIDDANRVRIKQIKDRRGQVLFKGPLLIDTIQHRKDHQEIALRRIQSSADGAV